jgi:hypothetical protein
MRQIIVTWWFSYMRLFAGRRGASCVVMSGVDQTCHHDYDVGGTSGETQMWDVDRAGVRQM